MIIAICETDSIQQSNKDKSKNNNNNLVGENSFSSAVSSSPAITPVEENAPSSYSLNKPSRRNTEIGVDVQNNNNKNKNDDDKNNDSHLLPLVVHHSPYEAYHNLPPSLRSHSFAYSSTVQVGSQSLFMLYSKVPKEQQLDPDDDEDDEDDEANDDDNELQNNNEAEKDGIFLAHALTPTEERARVMKIRNSKKQKKKKTTGDDDIDSDDPRFALVPPAKRKQLIELEKQERAERMKKKKKQKQIMALNNNSNNNFSSSVPPTRSSFNFGKEISGTNQNDSDDDDENEDHNGNSSSDNFIFAPGDRSWNILLPQGKTRDSTAAKYANWSDHNEMKKFAANYQRIHNALPAHQQLRSVAPILEEGESQKNSIASETTPGESQQQNQVVVDPTSRRKLLEDYGIEQQKSEEDFWAIHSSNNSLKNPHESVKPETKNQTTSNKKGITFNIEGVEEIQPAQDDDSSFSSSSSSRSSSFSFTTNEKKSGKGNRNHLSTENKKTANNSNLQKKDSALDFGTLLSSSSSSSNHGVDGMMTMGGGGKNAPVAFLCRYHENSGLRFRTRCDALISMNAERQRNKLLAFLRREVKNQVLEGRNFEIRFKRTSGGGFSVSHWIYPPPPPAKKKNSNINKNDDDIDDDDATAKRSDGGFSTISKVTGFSTATGFRKRSPSISMRSVRSNSMRGRSPQEVALRRSTSSEKMKATTKIVKTFLETIYDDLKSCLDERSVVLEEQNTSSPSSGKSKRRSFDEPQQVDSPRSPKSFNKTSRFDGNASLSSMTATASPTSPLSPTTTTSKSERSNNNTNNSGKEVFKTALGVSIAFVSFDKQSKEITNFVDLLSPEVNHLDEYQLQTDSAIKRVEDEVNSELFRAKELSTLLKQEIEKQRNKFLKKETEEEKAKRKKQMQNLSAKEKAAALANLNRPMYHHQRSNEIMRVCPPNHPSRGFSSKYFMDTPNRFLSHQNQHQNNNNNNRLLGGMGMMMTTNTASNDALDETLSVTSTSASGCSSTLQQQQQQNNHNHHHLSPSKLLGTSMNSSTTTTRSRAHSQTSTNVPTKTHHHPLRGGGRSYASSTTTSTSLGAQQHQQETTAPITEEDIRFFETNKNFKEAMLDRIDSRCVVVENIPSSEVLKKILEVDGIKQKFFFSSQQQNANNNDEDDDNISEQQNESDKNKNKNKNNHHHMIIVTLHATQRIAISQSKFARARFIFEEELRLPLEDGDGGENDNLEKSFHLNNATADEEAKRKKAQENNNNLYIISKKMIPPIVKKPVFVASCCLPSEFERKRDSSSVDIQDASSAAAAPSDRSVILKQFQHDDEKKKKEQPNNYSQEFIDATNALFNCVSKLHPPKQPANIVTDCITTLFDIVDCTNELELEFAKRKGILHQQQTVSQNISKKLEELVSKRKDLEQQLQKQMRKKFEVLDFEQQQKQLEQIKKEEKSRALKKQMQDLRAGRMMNMNTMMEGSANSVDFNATGASSAFSGTGFGAGPLERKKQRRRNVERDLYADEDSSSDEESRSLRHEQQQLDEMKRRKSLQNNSLANQQRQNRHSFVTDAVHGGGAISSPSIVVSTDNSTSVSATRKRSSSTLKKKLQQQQQADMSSLSWLNDALNDTSSFQESTSAYEEKLTHHQHHRTQSRAELLRKYDRVVEDRVKATERLFNAQKRLRNLREQLDHRHVEHLLEMKKRNEEIDQLMLESKHDLKLFAQQKKLEAQQEIEELKSGRKYLSVEDQVPGEKKRERKNDDHHHNNTTTVSSSTTITNRPSSAATKSTVPFAHHSSQMRQQRLRQQKEQEKLYFEDQEKTSANKNTSTFFQSSAFKNSLLRAAGVKTPDPKQMKKKLDQLRQQQSLSSSKFRNLPPRGGPQSKQQALRSFVAFQSGSPGETSPENTSVAQNQQQNPSKQNSNNLTSFTSNTSTSSLLAGKNTSFAGSFRLKKGAVSVLGSGRRKSHARGENDDNDDDEQDSNNEARNIFEGFDQDFTNNNSSTAGAGARRKKSEIGIKKDVSQSFGPMMEESFDDERVEKQKNRSSSSKKKRNDKKHVVFSDDDDQQTTTGRTRKQADQSSSSSSESVSSSPSSSSDDDDELDLWAPMKKGQQQHGSLRKTASSLVGGDVDFNNISITSGSARDQQQQNGEKSDGALPSEVLNLLRVASPSQRLTPGKNKTSSSKKRNSKKDSENKKLEIIHHHDHSQKSSSNATTSTRNSENNPLGIKRKAEQIELRDTLILYGMWLAYCEQHIKNHMPFDDTWRDNAATSVQLKTKASYSRVKTLPPKYNRRYSSDPVLEAQLARVANVAETAGCRFFLNAKQQLARDYVLLIDRSRSMYNGRRWKDAEEAVKVLAPHICKFDPDGITLIFFDHDAVKFDNVMEAKDVAQLFKTHPPRGSTNLARALDIAFQDHFNGERGATTIMVVTDGRPDNTEDVKRVIVEASNALGLDGELSISFVQIGNDEGATEYLKVLDDDLVEAQFDIVDSITSDEVKHISFNELVARSLFD